MADYAIRKPSEACFACEAPFEKGQEHFSAILLEEEEPARRDFCVACFDGRERDPEREFAFWKTRRTVGGPERRPVDFNTLRELFFRMAESHAGEYRKLCYLLGLVLLRKRVVKLEEFVTEQGRDYLVVTTKSRPEPLRLEAPELVPAEFEELRDKLKALLDVDLEEEAPGTTAAVTAGAAAGEAESGPAPDATA
ncbi:MAG: hypothetical protein ACF8XB_16065 [Planctomycetota bacterium JB042]